MKKNEIGHFPYLAPRTSFGEDDRYPKRYIAHDENGKLVLTKDGNIKWVTNWEILGEVELVNIPKNAPFGELLVDLQTANDCYCADELEVDGVKYVHLQGSGWADCGFPFYDDIFDIKDPYKIGNGCYALIRGLARNRFVKLAKKDYIPSFREISTGDYKKDFCLPK